jgi:hypothetical protein
VLVATHAPDAREQTIRFAEDLVALPLRTNSSGLAALIERVCSTRAFPVLDIEHWMAGGYRPTPTIIQAAEVLYRTHAVAEISRSEAEDQNLQETTTCVNEVIDRSRSESRKSICFVTGVPGSGKTLAGLNFATRRSEMHPDEHAVFLSGNGPLVAVLREALARDKSQRGTVSKKQATREVSSFVQNIHHFRDEYIKNLDVPLEKVVVFDEAQRAWTREKAASFMKQKKGLMDFAMSEPEFLISVMDRHPDWCTIICLVGGGQEINTGEAGIAEWLTALEDHFPTWEIYVSPSIELPEYVSATRAREVLASARVHADKHLHLAVCMRSYRAETLSNLMALILDNAHEEAASTFSALSKAYPLFLTRDLTAARNWLRTKARGSERFGLVASSGAQRLRTEGIYIKAKVDPANWFLNDRTDVRSSFYLEEVATEFDVQGLELDWVAVCWDGDLRHDGKKWSHSAFKGTRWQAVKDESKKLYLKNAYRVLLTRARQGMVLFVPPGDPSDPTSLPAIYDGIFCFLQKCGIPLLEPTVD